jgi:uncharacterized membrane protein YedE/YeeE
VSRHEVIVRQLQRKDWTVAKVMGTAIAVAATGLHALASEGRGELERKPLQLGGIVGGGALFGTGLALLGYCPGTTLAALGEGRRDAVAGALGMLAGAALFVRLFPAMKSLVSAGDLGKPALAESLKPAAWACVGALDSAVSAALVMEARARRSLWLSRT